MGNLKRLAKRVGILDPLQKSVVELKTCLKACEEKCESLKKTGWRARRRFLRERSSAAIEKEDYRTAEKILALIKREQARSFWGKVCDGKKEREECLTGAG